MSFALLNCILCLPLNLPCYSWFDAPFSTLCTSTSSTLLSTLATVFGKSGCSSISCVVLLLLFHLLPVFSSVCFLLFFVLHLLLHYAASITTSLLYFFVTLSLHYFYSISNSLYSSHLPFFLVSLLHILRLFVLLFLSLFFA